MPSRSPVPPVSHSHPLAPQITGDRGCGGAAERGSSGTPSSCLGRTATASCSGSCSSSALPRGHSCPMATVPPCQHPAGHGQHLLCHWDLPGPAENVQTSHHSAWPHRKREFPSLPPFHPCMTRPCTTPAFLHGISDNRQSCEMSEQPGKAGNGGAWEGAPMVGQARLKQPEREGGAHKCHPLKSR